MVLLHIFLLTGMQMMNQVVKYKVKYLELHSQRTGMENQKVHIHLME